jgi:hypothetical protein
LNVALDGPPTFGHPPALPGAGVPEVGPYVHDVCGFGSKKCRKLPALGYALYSGLQYVFVCAPATLHGVTPSPTHAGSAGTTGSIEPQSSKRYCVVPLLKL